MSVPLVNSIPLPWTKAILFRSLPLEVPINRVFAIATDDDLKDNAAVQGSDEVSDRLEMFVQNPVVSGFCLR